MSLSPKDGPHSLNSSSIDLSSYLSAPVSLVSCSLKITTDCLPPGPYGCVGKRLAMMELRRVIAETISRYDVSFAPGQTREAFLDGKQDSFTSVSAPLHLVFNARDLGSITA